MQFDGFLATVKVNVHKKGISYCYQKVTEMENPINLKKNVIHYTCLYYKFLHA